MVRRHRPRGLSTLLFTDIVASSEIAVELGDRRWRTLQARHHAEIRHQLKRYGGKEVDTAGDGFFATFESPAAGVRCAGAIVSTVRELGLNVRAGLHIGEVEFAGEKVSGIAVTTAARVCALAGPGQVLVTATIAQMVSGSGLEFAEIGARELKGVPGWWQLQELAAVDGVPLEPPLEPSVGVAARVQATPEEHPGRSSRRFFPAIAASVVVIGALGALAWPRSSNPPTPTPAGQTFSGVVAVKLDLTDGSVQPIDVPNVPFDLPAGPVVLTRPGGLSGQAFAWIVSVVPAGPRIALSQVDRASGNQVGRVLARGCLPPKPCVVAVDDRVWFVVTGNLDYSVFPGIAVEGVDVTGNDDPVVILVSSRSEIDSVRGMVFGNRGLWIGDTVLGVVYWVDLQTGDSRAFAQRGGVDSLAFGDGSLWIVDRFKGLLQRIDPVSGTEIDHTTVIGDPNSIAVGGGYVWVTDGSGNTLQKIPMGFDAPSTSIPVGTQPVAVAYAGGAVWVANHDDATVSRIDPNTSEVTPYSVGIHPSSIAVDGHEVWVAGNPSGIDRS